MTRAQQERLGGKLVVWGSIIFLVLYGWLLLGPVLLEAAPDMRSALIVYCQPCAPLAVLLLWRIQHGDPGRVSSMQHRGPNAEPCKVCGEMRPPGSHHCRTCGECVAGFDHHCGILGVCIACSNRLPFVMLLAVGTSASAQVLYCALLCASWEMHSGCASRSEGCGVWFIARLSLLYGVAILGLLQMVLWLLLGLGLQLVLLAMGLTFHECSEFVKSGGLGRAAVRCLQTSCGRLFLVLRCCLPASCLQTFQRALESLHEVGEGKIAKQGLQSGLALRIFSDLETVRYAGLMVMCFIFAIANLLMISFLPGGFASPASAADLLGTLLASVGCAFCAHGFNYSLKRLPGVLSFRRRPCGGGDGEEAPLAGDRIGACAADGDEDECGSLLDGGVAACGRWCEECGAKWGPLIAHCKHCDICVPRRDHHCALFGQCVGSHNRRPYQILLLFTWLGSATTVHIVWRRLSTTLPPLWAVLQNQNFAQVWEYAGVVWQPLAKEAFIAIAGGFMHFANCGAMLTMLLQQVLYYLYAEQLVSSDIGSGIFKTFGGGAWGSHTPPLPQSAKP